MSPPPKDSFRDLPPERSDIEREASFRTTQWTMVLSAAQKEGPENQACLAELCRIYWYPLYLYVRRRGYGHHDAKDLTQAFFERLLARESLAGITREGGKFRSFLLTSLNNFLTNEWVRGRAEKRGKGVSVVSFDEKDFEQRYKNEPVDNSTPESLFERRWALTLLEQALATLKAEFSRTHQPHIFDILKPHIIGEGTETYAQVAGKLGASEGSVKVTVHRLRERCQRLIREAVAQTVSDPDEVEEELRALLRAIAKK